MPQKNGMNHELYSVCRKLKWTNSGKIVRHFFLCMSCETVLNINLTTHHNILKRHSLKCNSALDKMGGLYSIETMLSRSHIKIKSSIYKEQASVQVVQEEFLPLVEALIRFGSIYGKISLKNVKVPRVIDNKKR